MSKSLTLASVIFLGGILLLPSSQGFSFSSTSNSLLDFSSGLFDNAGSFIKNKTKSFWNSLSEKEIFSLGGKKIQELLNDRESHKIPERAKEALRQVFRRNLTENEIKIKLRSSSSIEDYESLMYLKKLPPPSVWNKKNVTDMYTALKNAPESLMLQVMDSEALMYIKSKLRGVNEELQRNLFRKINGRADMWNNDTFGKLDLKKIPAENWKFIRPEVLVSRKNEIINTALYVDKNSAEIILVKLLELNDLKAQDDPAVAMRIANNLGSLKNYLMPEDFNEQILNNEEISNLLDNNIDREAEKEMLSFEGSKRVIMKFGKMENITSQNIKSDEIVLLGLALPTNLSTAIKNAAVSIDSATNVNNLLKGARNLPGLGAEAKADILVSAILDASGSSSVSIQSYDEEIWPKFPGFILEELGEGPSAEILKKNADFTKNQIQILLNKITKNGLGTLSEAYKELIPISKMADFAVSNYNDICKDLAPGSVVTMKFADSSLTDVKEITKSNLQSFDELLPFIGKKEAMLFNQTMIMDILKEIKDINPPSSACITLKDKVINYTKSIRNDFDENNPIRHLLDRDFSELPLCVLASYGTYALSDLTPDQNILLLSRLGKAENIELSIPRNVRMAIIEEGLAKLGSRTGLELGDLEVTGNAIADIPAKEMSNVADGIAYDFITKMNNAIEMNNGRKPCLDRDQMNAIVEMIKKVKGKEPSSWYNIRDICCLMFTLQKQDLEAIDDGLILTCSCKSPNPSVTQKMIDDMCQISQESKNNLMLEGEMQFEDVKMEASINVMAEIFADVRKDKMNSRRKRETMKDDVCNKASLGGAAAFSVSEINSLEAEVVVSCIAYFGASNLTQEKAEALARKVREVKSDFKMMKNKDVVALGYIMKGFSATEYKDFPSFKQEEFDETVEILGKMKGFSSSQEKQLARKIKDNWVSPQSMTAPDVMMVNNLICGYESPDISAIPEEAIKGSISVFADLECSRETLEDLTRVVKRTYGDIEKWGRGEVAELGGLIGSLTPEELMKIPPESMEGLTKAGIQKITADGIKAMSVAQVSFMNPLASASLSAEQKSAMTPEMVKTLTKTTVDTRRKSGSDAVTPLVTTILLPLLIISFQLNLS